MLIHGLNGSGKSTLAWIMAGLVVPTTGSCLLDGRPVSDQVGAVAISFQAARLRLMRSRVDLEIASAVGFDGHDRCLVEHALTTVGLDPALAGRRIDQLSGGQMRRVVLFAEFRVLFAARRLRPRELATTRRERRRRRSAELIDLMAAAMTVSLRRADEMGDAITARGGSGQISALPSRPTSADALALAVCALSMYAEVGTSLASSA